MSETFKSKPEAEINTEHLNNFYCYLPGGHYRDKRGVDPQKDAIMDAIDVLLAKDFTSIDPESIFKAVKEMDAFTQDVKMIYKRGEELDMEALERQEKEIKARSGEERLVPLFKRLVEMGFDPVLLKQ